MSGRKYRKKTTDDLIPPDENVEPMQTRQWFMRIVADNHPRIVESLFERAWGDFQQLSELRIADKGKGKSVLDLGIEERIAHYEKVFDRNWSEPQPNDDLPLLVGELEKFFELTEKTIPRPIFNEARSRWMVISEAIFWWRVSWRLPADWCQSFAHQVLLEHWKGRLRLPAPSGLSEADKRRESWERAIVAMRQEPLQQLLSPRGRELKKELQRTLRKCLPEERVKECLAEVLPILEKHFDKQKGIQKNEKHWKKRDVVNRLAATRKALYFIGLPVLPDFANLTL